MDTAFQAFPVQALPEVFAEFVRAASASIGCDASYVALPLLTAAASAIGNATRIELKPGWTEPAILWTAIVGESGTGKSPAMRAALRPVELRERQDLSDYQQDCLVAEAEQLEYQAALAAWKRGGAKHGEAPPAKPEAPVCRRHLVSDITVEALAARLAENPRGLLVARDELSGWLGSFDAYKNRRGADAPAWLSMWQAASLRVDRKTGNETIYVPRAAVSITGGVQPAVLRAALGSEHFSDGLAARLLLVYPPRHRKKWTEAALPASAWEDVEIAFGWLYSLEDGDGEPVDLPLTGEARQAWIAFYDAHAAEAAELEDGDLLAAWSKLEAYAARLALVIHLGRCACREASPDAVDAASVASGTELVEWFKGETRRLYAALRLSPEAAERRELAELLRRLGGSATARDVLRHSRSYATAEDAEAALGELARTGVGKWEGGGSCRGTRRPSGEGVPPKW